MKLVLTGPECSGKTTLATQLAEHYGVSIAPEPAREHFQPEQVYQPWICRSSQLLSAVWEINASPKLQVLDTDLQNIYLWWQEKFGPAPTTLQRCYADYSSQRDRIYLLCRPDIPWEFDPLRENPWDRDRLYQLYRDDLTARKLTYGVIEGQAEPALRLRLRFFAAAGHLAVLNFPRLKLEQCELFSR